MTREVVGSWWARDWSQAPRRRARRQRELKGEEENGGAGKRTGRAHRAGESNALSSCARETRVGEETGTGSMR